MWNITFSRIFKSYGKCDTSLLVSSLSFALCFSSWQICLGVKTGKIKDRFFFIYLLSKLPFKSLCLINSFSHKCDKHAEWDFWLFAWICVNPDSWFLGLIQWTNAKSFHLIKLKRQSKQWQKGEDPHLFPVWFLHLRFRFRFLTFDSPPWRFCGRRCQSGRWTGLSAKVGVWDKVDLPPFTSLSNCWGGVRSDGGWETSLGRPFFLFESKHAC